jgi:hypothetical protein
MPRAIPSNVFHETDDALKLQALAALGTGENAIDSEAAPEAPTIARERTLARQPMLALAGK